jgi:hypothetical protein
MFLPPVLRPLAAVGPVNSPVQRIAEAPFSVVRGPPGSYLAERLAGVIDSWERLQDCVWLRAPDRRPAELAQSLAVACRHRWSSGAIDVRAAPGPQLSEEIQMAPEGAIIVIELGGRVTTGVTRLVRAIRPAITDRGISVVVVAESRFHGPRWPDRYPSGHGNSRATRSSSIHLMKRSAPGQTGFSTWMIGPSLNPVMSKPGLLRVLSRNTETTSL